MISLCSKWYLMLEPSLLCWRSSRQWQYAVIVTTGYLFRWALTAFPLPFIQRLRNLAFLTPHFSCQDAKDFLSKLSLIVLEWCRSGWLRLQLCLLWRTQTRNDCPIHLIILLRNSVIVLIIRPDTFCVTNEFGNSCRNASLFDERLDEKNKKPHNAISK